MEISQKLEHRLIISPRLQQSLRLLTLNNLEIEQAIEEELEANPLLEWEPGRSSEDKAEDRSPDRLDNINWQEALSSMPRERYEPEGEEEVDPDAMAQVPPVTWSEHLLRQLEVAGASDRDFEIAATIISALDRDGYLRVGTAALASELGEDEREVERVLTGVVQLMDPPGVAARDLRECLLLQWREGEDEVSPLAGLIIQKHLDLLADKSQEKLSKALAATPEEVSAAIEYIKDLEPRPGRAFGSENNPALVPDIRVELVGGAVEITFLDERIGRLYVSPRYRELLAEGQDLDREAERFLRYRLKAAASFIRAIHQRRKTLEKVVAAVFERQRGFLALGEPGLKPLTMEEVANQLGFHVSTVSRATAGKVVDTPMGIFSLKYFFTGSVASSEGDVSVERVKALLEDIIADEEKGAPLSDEGLANELQKRGVQVARRTVAKYRKLLKIPGKHERKNV
jgi:RNA polymerase sigma-54 factor